MNKSLLIIVLALLFGFNIQFVSASQFDSTEKNLKSFFSAVGSKNPNMASVDSLQGEQGIKLKFSDYLSKAKESYFETKANCVNGIKKSAFTKEVSNLLQELNLKGGEAVNWIGENPVKTTALVSGGVISIVILRDMWKKLCYRDKNKIANKAFVLGTFASVGAVFVLVLTSDEAYLCEGAEEA
ncbi:hypothetical protein KAW80_04205 [Candidatus Babeliales bacterium]|nr:hypothetical protein [Candidatus Babeliales bacterium]